MEIQINCSRCGEKLMGPDCVTLGIDPHTCAPAPEPDVVCNDGVLRVLADGTRQFQNRHGEWENATNKHAFDKALAACVRALRAAVEYDNEPIGSKQELLAEEAYNSALDEARALGVKI